MVDKVLTQRRSSHGGKSLSPEKSAQAFLTQLKESRQAFDVFKEEAEKKGFLGKKEPLLHSHAQYYSKYIKHRNVPNDYSQSFALPSNLNKTSGETLHGHSLNLGSMRSGRNRITQSIDFPASTQARRKPFVPLKDLLQRNHDDRVREYLDKMKGLSIDEIVNTSNLNTKASSSKEDVLRTSGITPDKSIQGEGIFSSGTTPMGNQPSARANPSIMSVGVTPKQVQIIENAKGMAQQIGGAVKKPGMKLRQQFGTIAVESSQQLQVGSSRNAQFDQRRQSTRFPDIITDAGSKQTSNRTARKTIRKPDSEINLVPAAMVSPPKLPGYPQERSMSKRIDPTGAPTATISQGERSPIGQVVPTKSDNVSDNDSNASSSGMGVQKKTQNKNQKRTNALKVTRQNFDSDTNPALMKWFDKVAPEKRLKTIQQFRSYLEKRYQLPIANQIAGILAPRLQNNFQIPVLPDYYFKTIENFVYPERTDDLKKQEQLKRNKREEHLRFIFKLFDVFNEDKITQAGLFKFMEDASIRRSDLASVPTEILGLSDTENDIFLDIFSNTYTLITQALAKKENKDKLKKQAESFINKGGRNLRGQGSMPPIISSGANQQSDRGSSQNFFVSEQIAARNKSPKKIDRGVLGQSMMSVNSNEERESLARRTNHSRNTSNLMVSMEDTQAATLNGTPPKRPDHRKFANNKTKNWLDWNDFLHYMDEVLEERPAIIDDIVLHLTGVELVPTKREIREEDEYLLKKPQMPRADNDDELGAYKKQLIKAQYVAITQAFENLFWGPDKKDQVPGSHQDGIAVLTEANFIKNIKHVIGVDEPYFGKILYLWMSQGYDRAKITIAEFIEWLLPFKGENKQKQLHMCFEILDIDQDRQLNILNLLHLNKNLKPRTLLSREVIMCIEEYLAKNLMNSSKRINRIEIEFEGYHKLVTSSCIRNEIRRKFWSLPEPYEPNEPHSICETLTRDQLAVYYTDSQLEDRSFLFENIDYYEDVLPGQRGFGRNIDRLCNQLINFYHSKFKMQAEETLKKIDLRNKRIEAEKDLNVLQRNAMLPLSQQRKRNRAFDEDNEADMLELEAEDEEVDGENNAKGADL